MNSLTELNGFVNSFTLAYTDQRLPNVIFDRASPTNQTQSVDRGFTLSASLGIEITEILNPASSQPVYTIDVSNLNGATVTWASFPTGVTVTNTTAGVYVVEGFQDKTQWDAIKSPTIDFSDDYYGSWTYTSSISYTKFGSGAQTKTWTTSVIVNNILFFSNASQFIYELSAVSTITGVPQLGNLDAAYPGVTWTVTITPSATLSINTFTSTGTGGTFSVNGTTKVVTITGTRSQVNSRLSGLRIDANANAVDFVLSYFTSNSLNAVTDTKSQTLISQGLSILGAVTQPTIYYIEDSNFTITGAPVITDVGYDGSNLYIYTITPSDTAAIQSATIGGTGGTASFNASTKVISIQGTRSQVNGRLNAINIVTGVDYGVNFNLQYRCVTPRNDQADKIQVAAVGSNDTEVTNMNISRTYLSNQPNFIFSSNIPQISDLDATNPTYTVVFNSANGLFNIALNVSPYVEGSAPTNPFSITGTKDFINQKFGAIQFYPTAGFSSNTTFTYTQFKNGVQQVSQEVALLGSAGTYPYRVVDFISSQNWTPRPGDVLYGKIDSLLLVGGGGGGSVGGGGGGEVIYVTADYTLQNTSYSIQVGAGGAGSTTSSGNNGQNTVAFGYTARGGGGGQPVTNYSPFVGGNGGYSWDANGNQISGGTGGSQIYNSRQIYVGGGGAGTSGIQPNSGERRLTVWPFNLPNTTTNHNNAWLNGNTLTPGSGAVGRATAEFQNVATDNYWSTSFSYGFGGGGGYYTQGSFSQLGLGGWYDTPINSGETYGSGGSVRNDYVPANRIVTQARSPNKFVNGVRVSNVAGGGGGGCPPLVSSAAPATAGGDGVVRIIITGR